MNEARLDRRRGRRIPIMGQPLQGKVCVVTGASRGIGKGIALQLGEAGATVYITGRTMMSSESTNHRGSLQDTAREVEERGGTCIPVKCDHTDDKQVEELFDKIKKEQNGRLDLLVNNAYAGVECIFSQLDKGFWELPLSMWDIANNAGLRGYYIAAALAARMMVPAKQGLIINISSYAGAMYFFNAAYGIGKAGCDKMAFDCGQELKKHNVAYVSIWPGPARTELIKDFLLKDPFEKDVVMSNGFSRAESTEFAGKAVVHLMQDTNIMNKTGLILTTADLSSEYGFFDIDGRNPVNYRCIKDLVTLYGYTWLAMFIPRFIKVPAWMMAIINSRLY
ncbi:dehydrogenase/reductase SDR family member 1-like [Saccoglossus kowalevskii]|uniref:Dehydrogenase/reductase SDR family member 1-like n=1 Tax=Saccoglossus kowalevskii TaxID=10224 RepID=A0ABM0GQI1_SACKO|nr:PREDICTED: dehydrogenase/reductase SDR family member 1-like [Saccoglossus kowalevskii]